MIEKLLTPEAFVSYSSTLLGIIISAILIPIIINLYTKRRNRHKKELAEKILITKINNHLEILVPNKFKERTKHNVFGKKYPLGVGYIAHIISFSIKGTSSDELEKHFIRKFQSSNDNNTCKQIYSELINIRKDLEDFFYIYNDVFNKNMFREFYILDYNIQTQECNFEVCDEWNNKIFAETITIIIFVLDKMRKLILKNYNPIEGKFKIKLIEDASA